jgi:hypothetical protein
VRAKPQLLSRHHTHGIIIDDSTLSPDRIAQDAMQTFESHEQISRERVCVAGGSKALGILEIVTCRSVDSRKGRTVGAEKMPHLDPLDAHKPPGRIV